VKHELFPEDALAPGDVREVEIQGISIVVVRKADGSYRALRNRCSHQGGVLSKGCLEPMMDSNGLGDYAYSTDKEVLRCPLHHWEFDVDTGRSPAYPEKVRVRAYAVTIDNGTVFVER